MSVVYEAEDLKLGRHVALKVLPDATKCDWQAVERFQREARAAAALNHPNVCTVYEVDESGEYSFIAMELLRGSTLKDWIRATDPNPDPVQVIDIALQVTEALNAAHTQGVVHRDVKPSNIFLTSDGRAKILDFGLAKTILNMETNRGFDDPTVDSSEDHLTSPGSTVGTISYMSPEQVRGEQLDARTDLFSMGVVLYEMCTGTPPFTGETIGVIFDSILNRSPLPPSQINRQIFPGLEDLILKALEKEKQARYQSAAAMRADLNRLKTEAVFRQSAAEQEKKPTISRYTAVRVLLAALGLVISIAFAIVFFYLRSGVRHEDQPAQSQSIATVNKGTSALRAMGTIVVDTNIEDASVFLDGHKMFVGDQATQSSEMKRPWKITLPVGNHEIRVEKTGYQSASMAVDVAEGFQTHMQLTLLPAQMQLTPLPRADTEEIKELIEKRWKTAYETHNLDEAKAIWPDMSVPIQNAVKNAKGINLSLDCNPLTFKDTAIAKCSQTVTFHGKTITGSAVVFKLDKVGDKWQIKGSM